MAEIAPFHGWTYDFDRLGAPASLLAPPYDVISPEEQESLYASSPCNVIRLILGRKKTGDSDWDNRYTRTAETLKRWVAADVLVRSPGPAFYVTSVRYDPGDGSGPKTRWGVIALVRIEDEGSPVILPHERTFSAHKDDRLRLMRATSAQLSQIFALYEDPSNDVLGCFREALGRSPDLAFDYMDGTVHRVWAVRDRSVFSAVASAMADRSLLIADGHHRYETARNYRNLMRVRHGHRPSDRSYEFTMIYLSNMADPGLTVLPSHRLIHFLGDERETGFPDGVERWFEVSPLPWRLSEAPDHASAMRELIQKAGRDTVAFAHFRRGNEKGLLLRLRPGAEQDLGEDLHPSLRKLDVLVLSRLIFQRSLGYSLEALDNEDRFLYESDMRSALRGVASGECEMGFFLNPTKIDHVREVASNRLVMPRKSTYFFPKVLSGLVFNRMDPHELIQSP
ncbi:MAG: DUF1015 domain-containing protein [Deltaproteobacteria bacterium]|nr:DUF1015 domain-containing protein [Deltaproteobacteria bacterium]